MKPLDQSSVSHKPQGGPGGAKLSDFELESLLRQRPIVSHKFVFRCPACGNQLRTDLTAKGRFGQCPACETHVPVPRSRPQPFPRLL
jgi:DNA-directed RNA polymerase subunit RPC12/RpoP